MARSNARNNKKVPWKINNILNIGLVIEEVIEEELKCQK